MMNAAIEASGLKKSFAMKGKGRREAVEAVRGVDLSIRKGEIFGFLGPNGAGKTTCQRMLTTLLPIGGGSALVAGFDVQKQPREVRGHIGYVGQLGGADLPATGRENLLLAARLCGMSRDRAERKIAELARTLELDELLDRIARTYSGGQRRRLEVALGIIHEPEILFMDEPTTGLDPQNRANLWEHIRRLKERGMTVFLTTHYMAETERADMVCVIDRGQIVVSGTPEELRAQYSRSELSVRLRDEVTGMGRLMRLFPDGRLAAPPTPGDPWRLPVDAADEVMWMLYYLGDQVADFEYRHGSMDDVFLELTGHRDSDGTDAGGKKRSKPKRATHSDRQGRRG